MKIIGKIVKFTVKVGFIAGAIAFVFDRIGQKKETKKSRVHRYNGPYEKYVKRPLDCFVATGALVLLSPLMLVTSYLVKKKLGSPVFFKQARPGKGGKIFNLYKFRSMTDEKDADGNLLPDEVRLTGFGKKLRESSLDELPELINMVKGDMSLVGPRPLLVQYLPLYNSYQARRHEVRSGLTGLAQANGRNAISWEEKFDMDVRYVENISFRMDAAIIIKTILTVLKREGIGNGTADVMSEFRRSGHGE
jgi:lipopolysaccharide/colanic/teichoic acid biosynthesis glycosyltransferase